MVQVIQLLWKAPSLTYKYKYKSSLNIYNKRASLFYSNFYDKEKKQFYNIVTRLTGRGLEHTPVRLSTVLAKAAPSLSSWMSNVSTLYYIWLHISINVDFQFISCNWRARIRHQWWKTSVLSCHRCLIITGVEKMN